MIFVIKSQKNLSTNGAYMDRKHWEQRTIKSIAVKVFTPKSVGKLRAYTRISLINTNNYYLQEEYMR